jgi:serine/threonine-protein kinase RsbW
MRQSSGVSGAFCFRSFEEAEAALAAVAEAMGAAGYPPQDVFAVRLCLDEAVANAIEHGNGGDPRKRVRVHFYVTTERVLAEVEDDGPGFDPAEVPDPLAPGHEDRLSGRGLFLMRRYATWCRHSARGNRVTLCKCRSAQAATTAG